jgi:hypothetical protein
LLSMRLWQDRAVAFFRRPNVRRDFRHRPR